MSIVAPYPNLGARRALASLPVLAAWMTVPTATASASAPPVPELRQDAVPAPVVRLSARDDAQPDPLPGPPGGNGGWTPPPSASAAPSAHDVRWAVFGQATATAMGGFAYRAPYSGVNSLPGGQVRATFDATLFAGMRPWHGAELWANPEVDVGVGLGHVVGAAGYPSGEAYDRGQPTPRLRLHRLFLTQTFALGGETSRVDPQANRLGGAVNANRIVVTVGKFSVVDLFDVNTYAHDPRGDFLNWTVADAGAFAFVADSFGFTYGAAVEGYAGNWTLRGGAFSYTSDIEHVRPAQNQIVIEGEHRHDWRGRPGVLRAGVWRSRGDMARYRTALDAAQANGTVPDGNDVIERLERWGGYINAEQALTDTLGAFFRASMSDGRKLDFVFTDVTNSLSGGLSLAGKGWARANDTLGWALVTNGISRAARAYFAAGGLGKVVGDGQLPRAGREFISELTYTWRPTGALAVSGDWQLIVNPAYNRDRGPVNLLALRVHAGF